MNSGHLTVVLDASRTGTYTAMPLTDGQSTWDVLARTLQPWEGEGTRILVYGGSPPPDFPGERIPAESPGLGGLISFLNSRRDEFGEDGRILYHGAHMPFLDPGLVDRLRTVHEDYIAQFTFADGYPAGLAPQIISTEILGPLARIMDGGNPPVDDEGLFTAIQKDVNAFDVETELSEHDYRMLRVRFATDTRRDYLLCRRAAEALGLNPLPSARTLCSWIDDNPEQLRTLPAWIHLDCGVAPVQQVIYRPEAELLQHLQRGLPNLGPRVPLSADAARELVEPVLELAGDLSVSISALGEIGNHPDPIGLMEKLLELPGIDLIVETSGVGWDAAALRVLPDFSRKAGRRISWIVLLDSDDAETYQRVRGGGYSEAMDFVALLEASCPDRVWVQVCRIPELEDGLEALYRRWKQRASTLIVQKHDSFAGLLPDRRVADLSPSERFPCWHAKRDLLILADGTVLPCLSGLGRLEPLGSVTHGAESVWEAGAELYRKHLTGDLPATCASCDEYYTFNA